MRQVRAFELDELNLSNPAGLAFSPGAKVFHVVEDRGQSPPAEADIIKLTPFEDRVGSARIAAAIRDPINIVFDSPRQRLLIFQAPNNHLIEVLEDPDGNLDPTTLVRHDARHFGLQNPQGMTVDPASGRLFILDATGPRIVWIEPEPDGSFDNALISEVDLQPAGLVEPRGLAFDPSTGHLHLVIPAEQTLYELTQTGQVVATRDLSEFELSDPQGMVFAPSGDQTDDPLQMSLYITDRALVAGPDQGASLDESGQVGSLLASIDPAVVLAGSGWDDGVTSAESNAVSQNSGEIVELSFSQTVTPQASAFQASLNQTIDTSQWSPSSPDPAGIIYLPATNRLMISDCEVEEMPIYAGANLYETTLTGTLIYTLTTVAFSDEPTGVTLKPSNQHLFFSDDTGIPRVIYEMDPGPDGNYDSSDATTSFPAPGPDSEGITYAPEGATYPLGALFIVDGLNSEIYQITPGPDGVFDGVGDQVTQFDTSIFGLIDPEGIARNSDTGHLYAVGKPADTLFEITTAGTLVQTIDISAANAVKPAGLAYGPSSLISGTSAIYIVDRGVDNNTDPNENDGKIYEMTLPAPPGENVPPVANGDSGSTTEDTPAIVNVTGNDSDPNGNLDPTTAVTTILAANGGIINNSDGTFTYSPDPGFLGDDSFVYEICDTGGLCDTATVTMTVYGRQTIYVTPSVGGGNVGGVTFQDEDILAYDISTKSWSMYFHGADVGLDASGQEIDGFHINPDGSILLSLGMADTLPDVGAVDDFDIIRFIPTLTGDITAGSYELYFDGEDVELTDSNEDIDAIGFAPDGRLVVSTVGSFNVGGINGADEDLLIFTATSLGETTSGAWELYFDGSDVALDTEFSEDIYGTWIDDNGDIYLTARGDFSVTGVSGDGADIFICVPGSTGDNTSCTFSLYWNGSDHGMNHPINGFFVSREPPAADFTGLPTSGEAPLTVNFTDESSNNPTGWSWSFGDGTISSLQNPSHTYDNPGVYTVSLTASNSGGTDTVTSIDCITVTLRASTLYLPLIIKR